jgi:hypothetical protein
MLVTRLAWYMVHTLNGPCLLSIDFTWSSRTDKEEGLDQDIDGSASTGEHRREYGMDGLKSHSYCFLFSVKTFSTPNVGPTIRR